MLSGKTRTHTTNNDNWLKTTGEKTNLYKNSLFPRTIPVYKLTTDVDVSEILTMRGKIVYTTFIIFCAWQSHLSDGKYQLKPVKLPDRLDDVRIFTDEELAKFDGSNVNLCFGL